MKNGPARTGSQEVTSSILVSSTKQINNLQPPYSPVVKVALKAGPYPPRRFFFVHFDWNRIAQLPNYIDRSFAFKSDPISRAQVDKRERRIRSSFWSRAKIRIVYRGPRDKSGSDLFQTPALYSIGILPMKQLPAEGVVCIHRAR